MTLKALVAIKQVIDYSMQIRPKPDGSGIETEGLKWSMNPFDEIALEELILKKEAGQVSQVIAVSMGDNKAEVALRMAWARGVDKAIWVQHEAPLSSFTVASALKVLVEREKVDLVLLGRQAIDEDNAQTGPMLAALLNWVQAVSISHLDLSQNDHLIRVKREADSGVESLVLPLPAVLSADLRLNQPRFVSLPKLIQAKQKPIQTETLSQLAVAPQVSSIQQKIFVKDYTRACLMAKNARELVQNWVKAGIWPIQT